MTKETPKREPQTAPKKKRLYLTLPITKAMEDAIIQASRKALLKKATWARQFVLAQTNYDPDLDPDVTDLAEK